MNIDLTSVLIVGIICLVFIIGIRQLPQFRENSTKLLKNRIKERDERIQELDDDKKRYKQQYFNLLHKVEQEPEIPEMTGDLTNPENIKGIIATLLPTFADYLPKWAQGLARNPTVAGLAVDYFSKHPEQVTMILGKFMKPGDKKQGSTPQTESTQEKSAIPAGAEAY